MKGRFIEVESGLGEPTRNVEVPRDQPQLKAITSPRCPRLWPGEEWPAGFWS